MNLALLSIRRPAFITCVVLLMLAIGYLSVRGLAVDLFPKVNLPVVTVTVPYPGAGPIEMETLVAKVLEEEVSTLSGIKSVRSINKEGIVTVVAEFFLETDVKYAEQQIRDRVSTAKRKLPAEIKEPIIRRLDPSDQPVLVLAVSGELSEAELYDVANEVIKPQIEQVEQIGLVEIIGGRKREIRVELDRNKLSRREIPASVVSARISAAGQNVPVGKVSRGANETLFRSLGEFRSLEHIKATIVNFVGNDVPVTVGQLGTVIDSLEDEKSRAFVNGQKSVSILVFRQSGANTIAVAEGVKKRLAKINQSLQAEPGKPQIKLIRDMSKYILENVKDVEETIFIGIVLTILVVFFFLGNVRSTIITGLALPNSLLGAFILMALFGFSINVMTLLALSLAVGLLIDDAIVVRENIFRYRELGKGPVEASLTGTREVTLAVIATTLTVIAVFGPVAFLKGMVGQFFKEFGLTVCFAMMISLFDALTIAPMLSAYFAAGAHDSRKGPPKGVRGVLEKAMGAVLGCFNYLERKITGYYGRVLEFTLRRPLVVLGIALGVFMFGVGLTSRITKTFLPPQDFGQFAVALDLPPGTSIERMSEVARAVDERIRRNPEVDKTVLTIGNRDGEPNVADFFVELVPRKKRDVNTSQFKDRLREQLKEHAHANPIVKDVDDIGGGIRPFTVIFLGNDLVKLEEYARKIHAKIKDHPALKDVDVSSRPGKPEFQVTIDEVAAQSLGVSTVTLGVELRTQIEGAVPAVFREKGREYDIRVRLQEDQRNLKESFPLTSVPNINGTMIKLTNVAKGVETVSPATIYRQDRGRYVQVSADISATGPGMGAAMDEVKRLVEKDPEFKLPDGVRYKFMGQSEDFQDLIANMLLAVVLAVFFIYLVLASLYESFVTPFTIMLVIPLAACGVFYALFLTGKSLDIFSMIGCVMLLGIATKNSILIVDRANQNLRGGMNRRDALLEAGKTRLRPILMTSFALIAGMIPVAIGLNEASKQRTSMGVSIIGGLVTSTFLSLVVIPAAFSYIDRYRIWAKGIVNRIFRRQPITDVQMQEEIVRSDRELEGEGPGSNATH